MTRDASARTARLHEIRVRRTSPISFFITRILPPQEKRGRLERSVRRLSQRATFHSRTPLLRDGGGIPMVKSFQPRLIWILLMTFVFVTAESRVLAQASGGVSFDGN